LCVCIKRALGWVFCSPSDVTFTIRAKAYLDQREPFDFDYPTVKLLEPQGPKILSGIQEIKWEASTRFRPIRISLLYSKDQGKSWIPIAYGLDNTGKYLWNTGNIEDGDNYLIKVLAINGVSASGVQSSGIKIMNVRFSPQLASLNKNILVLLQK